MSSPLLKMAVEVSRQTLIAGVLFGFITILSLSVLSNRQSLQLQTTVSLPIAPPLLFNSSTKNKSRSLEAHDATLGLHLQVNFSELRLANLNMSRRVAFSSREELYNPSLLATAGQLWLYTRFEGRNRTGTYDRCPDSSLTTVIPCPVQDIRMISFVVRCQLNQKLGCK